MYIYVYTCICIYVCVYIYIYICTYVYMFRARSPPDPARSPRDPARIARLWTLMIQYKNIFMDHYCIREENPRIRIRELIFFNKRKKTLNKKTYIYIYTYTAVPSSFC